MFRVSVLMEFVGHGAFGVMTKASWVPYFGVFGISEPIAGSSAVAVLVDYVRQTGVGR